MSQFRAISLLQLITTLLLGLIFVWHGSAIAQPAPPPPMQRPPPTFDPNADLEDSEIEDLEGEMPAGRPPLPPPPPSQQYSAPSPPSGDFKPIGANGKPADEKFHFHLVDGEFFEKGKRRGRATDNRKNYSKPSHPSVDPSQQPSESTDF